MGSQKIILLYFSALLCLLSCSGKGTKSSSQKKPSQARRIVATSVLQTPIPSKVTSPLKFEMISIPGVDGQIRTGIAWEEKKIKGCVLYLQGFADSIKNHSNLFKALAANGYRVIGFDYAGQGGSEGDMNSMRVQAGENEKEFPDLLQMAEFVWDLYSHKASPAGDICPQKKLVLGWSTGGLVAYRMAAEKRADAVVLLAPGIKLRKIVGDGFVVTRETLTRNKNFHKNTEFDPIKPASPLSVPYFSWNLLKTAKKSQDWRIPEEVKGFVFFSGAEDSYVDRDKSREIIKTQAPHFVLKSYEGALHELDNELPEVASDVIDSTIHFFDQVAQ